MGHTLHSFWEGIISPMPRETELPPTLNMKSETLFTLSFTLKSTLPQQHKWQRGIAALENNSFSSKFSLVATNTFCHQMLF